MIPQSQFKEPIVTEGQSSFWKCCLEIILRKKKKGNNFKKKMQMEAKISDELKAVEQKHLLLKMIICTRNT